MNEFIKSVEMVVIFKSPRSNDWFNASYLIHIWFLPLFSRLKQRIELIICKYMCHICRILRHASILVDSLLILLDCWKSSFSSCTCCDWTRRNTRNISMYYVWFIVCSKIYITISSLYLQPFSHSNHPTNFGCPHHFLSHWNQNLGSL